MGKEIVINFEKKHFVYLSLFLMIFGSVSFVLATGWSSGKEFHNPFYVDEIRGKSGDTVTVNDDLEVVGTIYGELTDEVHGEAEGENNYYTLESASTHTCFLTRQWIDCEQGCSENGCRVYVDYNGDWKMKAYSYNTVNSDEVTCSARCISYGPSGDSGLVSGDEEDKEGYISNNPND